jgi:hypothetical protein
MKELYTRMPTAVRFEGTVVRHSANNAVLFHLKCNNYRRLAAPIWLSPYEWINCHMDGCDHTIQVPFQETAEKCQRAIRQRIEEYEELKRLG